MTLQVCAVGTDGIVLASDQKTVQYNGIRQEYLGTKIFVDKNKRVAVAHSGHEICERVARRVLSEFRREWLEDDCICARAQATSVLDESRNDYPDPKGLQGQVIIVSANDLKRFFVLNVRNHSDSSVVRDKRACGDGSNPAIFFLQGYYQKTSVSKLIRLAAQTIVTGSRFNRNGVEGLEILLCNEEGFEFLGDEKMESLVNESKQLEDEIGLRCLAGPSTLSRD